jgi:hypothetical protein
MGAVGDAGEAKVGVGEGEGGARAVGGAVGDSHESHCSGIHKDRGTTRRYSHQTSRKNQVQRTLQQGWSEDSVESASRIKVRVIRINLDALFYVFT